jgi:hypothetical protein
VSSRFNPPLQVVQMISTRRDDPERGPAVWLRSDEAAIRMLTDGELTWVQTPRRNELAEVHIDDSVARGMVVLRDVFGASVSEVITLTKPDFDTPPPRGLA